MSEAVQHIFISNPLRKFDEQASALFSTHPPIRQRVERLMNLS